MQTYLQKSMYKTDAGTFIQRRKKKKQDKKKTTWVGGIDFDTQQNNVPKSGPKIYHHK